MAPLARTAFVAGLVSVCSAAPSVKPRTADDGLKVQTSSGLVNGIINTTYPQVRQFLGVPFAQPPLSTLRFHPPQPITAPSADPIDATTTPKACSQYLSSSPSVYTLDAPEFSNGAPVSEDCLTVSIWTPTPDKCAENSEDDKDGLPVLIWIYGGGFQTGSASVPYQIPLEWIQRSQSHIVVAIQYRLNIFGYPNAEGLETQNPGLLDQRAAIEWTRDNIAAFGGDSERMTTWGQSAGAFSVDFLNFAYPDDPIVKSQICDSGSALIPSYTEPANSFSNFSFVAQSLNCASKLSGATPQEELSCVQTLPEQTLLDFLQGYSDNGTQPSLSFVPTQDESTVFANYTERYQLGPGKGVSDIPAIFGSNDNEGVSLITYPDDPALPPNLTMARTVTLRSFLCPAAASTDLREEAGLKTFRYLYKGNFTDVSPRYWLGAYHSSELPQVFGTRGEFRGPATDFEVQTSEAMQDRWLNFARDPVVAEGWNEAGTGQLDVFGGAMEAVGVEGIEEVQQECVARGLL